MTNLPLPKFYLSSTPLPGLQRSVLEIHLDEINRAYGLMRLPSPPPSLPSPWTIRNNEITKKQKTNLLRPRNHSPKTGHFSACFSDRTITIVSLENEATTYNAIFWLVDGSNWFLTFEKGFSSFEESRRHCFFWNELDFMWLDCSYFWLFYQCIHCL